MQLNMTQIFSKCIRYYDENVSFSLFPHFCKVELKSLLENDKFHENIGHLCICNMKSKHLGVVGMHAERVQTNTETAVEKESRKNCRLTLDLCVCQLFPFKYTE
jgi:hypothetical protein